MKLPDGAWTGQRIVRALLGVALLIAVLAIVGSAVHAPVTLFAADLVGRLGVVGLFLAVVLLDPVPAVGFALVVFLGHAGGIGFWSLFGVTWAATLVASAGMFALGRGLAGQPWLVGRVERSGVGPWLRRSGARGIAAAAVAPCPYGLVTLGAGVTGVPFGALLVGASARGIKILLTILAIQAGWGGA